jgi:hypothetical protein
MTGTSHPKFNVIVPKFPDECEPHTPCPSGYLEWHAWSLRKSRTHIQRQCKGCGLWAIWEPKPAVAVGRDTTGGTHYVEEIRRLRDALKEAGAEMDRRYEMGREAGAAQATAAERERNREHILNRARQLEPLADKATITELRILAEELGWTGGTR